jgi:hypothetical protein
VIVGALSDAIVGALSALLSLIPDFDPFNRSDGAQDGLLGLVQTGNHFLPLGTMVLVLTVYFAVRGGLAAWGLIVWTYHQFWGGD